MPRPFSEEQRRRAIRMKEMLGYQVNELAAALKMPLSFDPTTLIEIAVYILYVKGRTGEYRFAFPRTSLDRGSLNCGSTVFVLRRRQISCTICNIRVSRRIMAK